MADFFTKISDEEWKRKYAKKAQEYDDREQQHAHGAEDTLTREKLKKIVDAQNAEESNTNQSPKPSS
jgi:hypothetical protein